MGRVMPVIAAVSLKMLILKKSRKSKEKRIVQMLRPTENPKESWFTQNNIFTNIK